MPTYPVKNKETGEEKELRMSMQEYCDWKDANPDWDKDWSKGVAGVGEVGDWQSKMKTTHPGWADIMKNKVLPKAPTNSSIAEKWG
tara:strand:- start:74 stop:331 length:258 start_codon:yes stop_codon:yes gene_type:complete